MLPVGRLQLQTFCQEVISPSQAATMRVEAGTSVWLRSCATDKLKI